MKKSLFITLLVLAVAAPVRAQVGIEFGSAIATRYIWRGFDLSGVAGKTVPAFQPTATVDFGQFSVNWWGSVNLAERDNEPIGSSNFDEFDIAIGTSRTLVEGLSVDFGMIYYTFPQFQSGGNKSVEWYMGFSTDKVSFEPSVTFYYDTDLANGLYYAFAGSQPIITAPKFPVNLDFSLGAGYSYFVDGAALHDINFGLSTSWGNDHVSFSPSVTYTLTPSNKIQDFNGDDDDGELWGLFSLDFAF